MLTKIALSGVILAVSLYIIALAHSDNEEAYCGDCDSSSAYCDMLKPSTL